MKTTREIADEIRHGRGIGNEHDAATVSRVLLTKDNQEAIDADKVSESGVKAIYSPLAGIPFSVDVTLGQSVESVPLISDDLVPEGMGIRVSGFSARVLGENDWVDADIEISGSEGALIATIAKTALTDGATIHHFSDSVTLENEWFNSQFELAINLSDTETTGSDVIIRIFGVIS